MSNPVIQVRLNEAYPKFAAQIASGVNRRNLAYALPKFQESEPMPRTLPQPNVDSRAFSRTSPTAFGSIPINFDAVSFFSLSDTYLTRLAEEIGTNGPLSAWWMQDSNSLWTPDPPAVLQPLNYVESQLLPEDLQSGQSPWITRIKSDILADDADPNSLGDPTQVAVPHRIRGFNRAFVRILFLDAADAPDTTGTCDFTVWYPSLGGSPSWIQYFPPVPPQAYAHGDMIEIPDTMGQDVFIRILNPAGVALDHIRIQVKGIR
jgi:hypothetical protein